MTNKEIKLELAKVTLERCAFTTSETLTESIKNLYEWVIEEQEVEEETIDKNSFDSVDIKEVLNIVRKIKALVAASQQRLKQYSTKTTSILSAI